ncbi:TPA: hypothetical protein ACNH9M_000723 [Enterobacter hormaechei]|nr:hypothetical protein [Enterobacter hormaechei]
MAAQRLDISDSHSQRLLLRYNESGPLGMAGRRRGKPGNNQLSDGLARYAFNIIRERYTDFGPTLPARNTKNFTMFTCQNIGKYIEVWHYPDGRKELRLNGVILPYSTYNRIQEID